MLSIDETIDAVDERIRPPALHATQRSVVLL
jgi:hypothetical protein